MRGGRFCSCCISNSKSSQYDHNMYHTRAPCHPAYSHPVTHSHAVRELARPCAGLWMKLSLSTGTGLNSKEDRMAPIQQHSSLAPHRHLTITSNVHSRFYSVQCLQLHNVSQEIIAFQKKGAYYWQHSKLFSLFGKYF